jgi:hypothetical protein
MTLMSEPTDSWYIKYTTPLHLIGGLFYIPVSFIFLISYFLFSQPIMEIYYVFAFIQSSLLTYIFIYKKSKLQMSKAQQDAAANP